jgi:CheY-like chemotaxis protein
MPKMSGLELARAIRAEASLGAPPLVMLSSVEHDEDESVEAGIEFFLTRPVRQSHLYDCLVNALRAKIQDGAAQPGHGLPAQLDATILVVEDNPVNQELAAHMLQHLGCRATVARNGREAVSMTENTAYDAVLMDCQMPEMDGFEATATIRQREASQRAERRLPIVALTAGAVEGDRDKCLAAGMNDYLSKPFSLDQLEEVLRRWLPAVPSTKPHVDAQVIESMLVLGGGGRDLLAKMIELFVRDAPERLAAIRQSMGRGDARAVAAAAHAFKSSSANLGAAALSEMCKRLERECGGGALAASQPLVEAIEGEYAYVAADLAGRLRETAA